MENQYSIKGTVTQSDGNPLSQFRVVAYDRDLRSREFLGESVTDANGRYEIGYSKDRAGQYEHGTADIVIEVLSAAYGEQQEVLAASETLFNAPENAVIDITVPAESYPPLSEYERLANLVQPLLEGLSPAELEESEENRDITFLHGETGWDKNKLTRYALAHRLLGKNFLPAEFWYALLTSPILMADPAASLTEKAENIVKLLPSFSEGSVREQLEIGFAENRIDRLLNANVETWLDLYHGFMLQFIGRQDNASALKQALEISNISEKKQEVALSAYLKYDSAESHWTDALAHNADFTDEDVREIKTTFTLADMTMGNIGLVGQLKDVLGETDPGNLAKLDDQEWLLLVKNHDSGLFVSDLPEDLAAMTGDLHQQIIAKKIAENFRRAYPTVSFSANLERDLNAEEGTIPFSENLVEFLRGNEGFDLLSSRVDEVIAGDDLKQELKGIQRVFKLTNDYRTTSVLLADDTHSAQQIYAMGEGQFIARYSEAGLDKKLLKTAYARAANTHAAVMSLVGELKSMENAQSIAALNAGGDVAELFPNWKTLFGAADVCECEHCRSVYSPGAYFADILMFLKHRSARIGNVKDLLLSRRPDLGYLELSCENANTELPYVDVVCEVLEEAISPSNIFTLVTPFPSTGTVSAAIVLEFAAAGISLSPDAVINEIRESLVSPLKAHTIRDERHSFRVALDGKVFEMHQTRGAADELAAIPQYVNSAAYAKLKSASYPMSLPADYINKDLKPSLPFDLFSEEMRAYLGKHGIGRWELMRTLQGSAAPNDPSAGDIAAEYFGISIDRVLSLPGIDEKRIILTAVPNLVAQRVFWGEPVATSENDLTAKVGNVSAFLDKTGLQYNELLKLLDLSFINPTGGIAVVHHDTSCDTVKKSLSNLSFAALDRIHRFLRLWRKLGGWQLWELNLAVMHPLTGAGVLDEPFLIRLFSFAELKDRLEISVEEAAGLFARFAPGYLDRSGISIESKFTEPFHDREPSLYEKLFLNKKKTDPLDPAFEIAEVTAALPPEKITGHKPVVMAALKLKEADLDALLDHEGLIVPDNTLSLGNLGKIYRHAMLMRALKMKATEYLIWLKVSETDFASSFSTPELALEWWQFTPAAREPADIKADDLNYLLRADLTAKAAPSEKNVAAFLTQLRKALKEIKNEYDARQYEALDTIARLDEIDAAVTALEDELGLVIPPLTPAEIAAQADELRNTLRKGLVGRIGEILRPLLQKTGRSDAEIDLIFAVFANDLRQETKVPSLAAAPAFPPGSNAAFDNVTKILSFSGMMSDAEKTSLQALNSDPAYISAVGEMHRLPRLWVKFILPFTAEAPLATLPDTVDFAGLPKALADKVSFDGENSLLRFAGIMTAPEYAQLFDLSTDSFYQTAITSLFDAPGASADGIWRTNAEIPPEEADGVKIFKKATTELQAYFAKTLSETLVNQQFTESLAISPDLTELILKKNLVSVVGPLIYTFINDMFVDSQNPITRADADFTDQFEHYYWLHRVSWLIRKFAADLTEMAWLLGYNYQSNDKDILNFRELPFNDLAPAASYRQFINLNDLFELQRAHSTETLTVFDIIGKISADPAYDEVMFGDDMHRLHEEWQSADVRDLALLLDLVYPQDYVFVGSWQRLIKALGYTQKLNGSAVSVLTLANPTVGSAETSLLKKMLRAGYDDEQWFELNKDVQNMLRDRKRDSLVAYLLDQPAPAGNPTSKWENANDLYAYYLLDVQMGDCLLTSRLVQASGSIQLFVQRCFIGLEPDVQIDTKSDNADLRWLQWEWMSKYQVWVANRKIFLYPENWLEPQFRRDKSPFFKDLENELQQNEVSKDNVETAFLNYIDKLDDVAQLEIAGFYYEEEKDTFHVFGRTSPAEPHIYYYRQFDENRGIWTAWTKIPVDITGDYLISTMINGRLYIFWPVFTEEPEQISSVPIPTSGGGGTAETAKKFLKVQIAVSEFRNNKWQPKKISRDALQSGLYKGDLNKSLYTFRPIDLREEEGKFLIQCETAGDVSSAVRGCFEIFGCKGIPEKIDHRVLNFTEIIDPLDSAPLFMRPTELGIRRDDYFALRNNSALVPPKGRLPYAAGNRIGIPDNEIILGKTPGIFKVTRPLEPSFFDKIFLDNLFLDQLSDKFKKTLEGVYSSFFYADKTRTFFVKPALVPPGTEGSKNYYPQIKRDAKAVIKSFSDIAEEFIAAATPAELSAAANSIASYLRQYGYPQERIPEDPGDVVRLLYLLYANYSIGLSTIHLYTSKRYHFKNYYHPFPCLFAKQVSNLGIGGLMKREVQLKNTALGAKYYPKGNIGKFDFKKVYAPTYLVLDRTVDTNPAKDYKYYPMEVVDFTADGSYSQYNWELFFHAPLMIASRLSQDQQFSEAREWFHYIFNPLDPTVTTDDLGNPTTQKFWITYPFFAMQEQDYKNQRIENILNLLSGTRSSDLETTELEKQTMKWRSDPLDPNLIAQTRPIAYQKTVIMKYLDNLIAWGDQLFGQDSMESINEATQLYILAAEILGPRPRKVSPKYRPVSLSFNELEGKLDAFSNAAITLENLIPAIEAAEGSPSPVEPPLPGWLYFCIPQNDKILGYWDTVADRLYKIRHCMNIDGVVRKLSLFKPPIDPGALANALAGGASLSGALADLNAPAPMYRFNVMLQKANELCGDVKSLGGALLSALEKKDDAAIMLLRQTHELAVLNAVREIKEKQIEDARITLEALKKNKELITDRRNYYEGREFTNTGEKVAMGLNIASTALDASVAAGYILAGGLKLIPNFVIGASGFGGSPHGVIDTGGKQVGESAENAVKTLSSISHAFDKGASIANTLASYRRRMDDWQFQARSASKELENINIQITSAELKIKIAEKELKNHDLQVENSKAVDEFMRSKYTNQELYEWMITQISQVYFQSYQLAYDLAKRAEKCYQFELGSEKIYLQFGYWNSLRKGLMSGEKLQYGLRRLENAYLEQNRREFELSKYVSLALTHPAQLVELKEKGRCTIHLPEELFDFDYQGHYFRRVKSVSLSIPCIAGPYTTVNATLRLLKNELRINSSLTGGYAKVDDSDMRFRNNPVGVTSVATSSGQNDSGVFELNFKDERYLPFEEAGAASTWSIELTEDKALHQFDYDTISDVILHLKYTAREDAGTFKNEAVKHLKTVVKEAVENTPMPLTQIFDVKHEFPNEYHAFKESGANAVLKLVLGKNRFPFFAAEAKDLTIKTMQILGRFDTSNSTVDLNVENSDGVKLFELEKLSSRFGEELKYDSEEMDFAVGEGDDEWKFSNLSLSELNLLSDLYIIVDYKYNY